MPLPAAKPHRPLPPLLCGAWLATLLSPLAAAPEFRLPTGPLAVNESVEVALTLDAGDEFVGEPKITVPTGLSLSQPPEFERLQGPRQRVFRLTALEAGNWSLGPVAFQTRQGKNTLRALPVRAREEPIGELVPIAGSHAFLALATDLDQVYVGQRSHFEATIFLPRGARLVNTRSPLDLSRERLVAAPPVDLRHGQVRQLNGEAYDTWTYVGQFTALAEGEASLGPGTLGVVLEEVTHRGPSFASTLETRHRRETLVSGRLPIRVLPLPDGAPADFRGAVGRYRLDCVGVSPAQPRAGDPIYLEFVASGDGDLPRLPAPVAVDADDWRIELLPDDSGSRSAIENSGERRFTFVLRPHPQRAPARLPNFRLSWFDPLESRYDGCEVAPPAVPMLALVPPSGPISPGYDELHPADTEGVPAEAPDIVVGPLDPRAGLRCAADLPWRRSTLPLHAGGAGLVLALALAGGVTRTLRQRRVDPRRQWLQPLAKARNVAQAAAALQHLLVQLEPHSPRPDSLAELAASRADLETLAYRRGGNPEQPLERSLQQRLLATARRALPPTPSAARSRFRLARPPVEISALLLLVSGFAPDLRAADAVAPTPPIQAGTQAAARSENPATTAASPALPGSADAIPETETIPGLDAGWDALAAGDAARARDLWLAWGRRHGYSANLCVLLGDAHYRLDDSARATLWYRRALLLDPWQAEARHNLAIAHPRGSDGSGLSRDELSLLHRLRAPLRWLGPASWWFAACCALAPVALPLRRRHPWWIAAVAGLGLALVAVMLGNLWSGVAEPEERFTLLETTSLHAIPTRGGAPLLTLRSGDSCRLLAARGPWNYVEFQHRDDAPQRGWIPATAGEALWPPPR